jgi:hypothetical protein
MSGKATAPEPSAGKHAGGRKRTDRDLRTVALIGLLVVAAWCSFEGHWTAMVVIDVLVIVIGLHWARERSKR